MSENGTLGNHLQKEGSLPGVCWEHTADKCIVSDKVDFKCASCNGNHRASSTLCEYYKQALIISGELQQQNITREQATKLYAQFYDQKSDETSNRQSRTNTPNKVSIPGVVFETQEEFFPPSPVFPLFISLCLSLSLSLAIISNNDQ